ncbi:hypothetical protein RBI80_23020 [Klebsiella variicola]|nr:hypothetical protein RBI80_23020 [Klebsiella variicola]
MAPGRTWTAYSLFRRGRPSGWGAINGPGVRSYLCLRGGIQVPDYLGSKAPLPSASLAATADGRYALATCCILRLWLRQGKARRFPQGCAPR